MNFENDPPASDELEVSLFGPSFGEAIALHLGEGEWLLVDSCLDEDGKPVTLNYLNALGVQPERIKAIVASHWHDDHVAGLSQLVDKYTAAELFIPNYFSQKEGIEYLAAYSGDLAPQARGTHEIYRSLNSSVRPPVPAGRRVVIYRKKLNGIDISAHALSPVPAAWGQAMAALLGHLPTANKQIKHATVPKTNIASVVVHVTVGEQALLLGSDLEKHGTYGWQAVVNDAFSVGLPKADFYKVAHHGSETAHIPKLWTNLLSNKPIAALTPFINGSSTLPKESDIARLKDHAQAVYSTSQATAKPQMSRQSEQLLKGIGKNLRVVNRKMGHWRFRRPVAGGAWAAKGQGAAQAL